MCGILSVAFGQPTHASEPCTEPFVEDEFYQAPLAKVLTFVFAGERFAIPREYVIHSNYYGPGCLINAERLVFEFWMSDKRPPQTSTFYRGTLTPNESPPRDASDSVVEVIVLEDRDGWGRGPVIDRIKKAEFDIFYTSGSYRFHSERTVRETWVSDKTSSLFAECYAHYCKTSFDDYKNGFTYQITMDSSLSLEMQEILKSIRSLIQNWRTKR